MAHTSIWVPGTIVQAEHLDQLAALIRKGWGTFFKQEEGFNWFHIPIAAPFALDAQNLALTTVFVFYRATDGLRIRSIQVYSGPRRIQAFDDLHAAGDNTEMSDRLRSSNVDAINARLHHIRSGHFRRRRFSRWRRNLFHRCRRLLSIV